MVLAALVKYAALAGAVALVVIAALERIAAPRPAAKNIVTHKE